MKRVIRLNTWQRIANSLTQESLLDLITQAMEGRITLAEMEERLRQELATDRHFGGTSRAMDSLVNQVEQSYRAGRPNNPIQSKALAETIHQRAINKLHLADYQARGTRLVQVRAIIDSRTTEQCRNMNGRIFRLDDVLQSETSQTHLVHNDDWWHNVQYFQGVPTYDVIPSLPPYHYNCRTRIVPYIHADEYENFASMPADHALYPTILQDRLSNYDLEPQHLGGIRQYAGTSQWKQGELMDHFQKHNPHFRHRFDTPADYSKAALDLLWDDATTLMIHAPFHGARIQIYAMAPDPHSHSGNWQIAVFDLDTKNILSYYKKDPSYITKFINRDDYRKQTFGSQPTTKREETMSMMVENYSVKQALGAMEELTPIDAYEYAIEAVQKKEEHDFCLYQDDCVFFRMNTLRVLIGANMLSEEDLARIRKVDRFILAAKWLPCTLAPLQDWLKDNHL